MKQNKNEMALSGHLKELRNRIIICIVALFFGLLICFNWSGTIVNLLTSLGASLGYEFIAIAPQELFMQYIRIALIGSVCICIPILAYQVWAFMQPGLKKEESFLFIISMIGGFGFFVLGVLFAYKIAMPFMLYFFINVGIGTNVVTSISIANYISFLFSIFITFGIVFEMPMVSIILTQLGILKPEFMVKSRSVVIVLIFIVAAIITPPDVVSQTMVALPMILLYEISIVFCKLFRKKLIRKQDSEGE